MANPGARRKGHAIARLQRMKNTIYPCIRSAFDYIDKLLFGALSVRVGGAPARQQPHMMNSKPCEAQLSTEGGVQAHRFVISDVSMRLRGLQF
jgi:hypothetical protein